KLRKNKDQLMTKYACRTVKFQVYVKENKAALKATPVKD
ncbi:MAG TPA: MXAN_5187 C-terminal domain-containing protein, partial [Myxococcaceae bacterium]